MNYSQVVFLALSYADRTDAEVTNRMDNFLQIVESRVNRLIKTMDMSVRTSTVTILGQEYYPLPVDYEGMRDIELKSTVTSLDKVTLHYLNPEQLNGMTSAKAGRNVYYTIVAGQIQISPPSEGSETLELIYYRKVPALSNLAPENWLSAAHPDVYVFGLMTEICAFLKDIPASELWDRRFKEALEELQVNDTSKRWAGSALQTRTE